MFLLAVAAHSANADDSEPLRIEYTGSRGCPDESDFVQALVSHTSRARLAGGGESARTFRVTLEDAGSEARGTLVVLDHGHAGLPRSVRGRTCSEAMRAVAFIAALSIDPNAKATVSGGNAESRYEPEVSTPSPNSRPMQAAEAEKPTADSESVSAQPAPAPRPTEERSHPESSRRRWIWAAGAGGDALGLSAPGATGAIRVFGAWRWESSGIFSPGIRLSAIRTMRSAVDVASTHTVFSWTFGRAEFSAFRLGSSPWVELSPLMDIGVVAAEGGGASRSQDRTRPWITAGTLLRTGLELVRPLALEGEVGGIVPLLRESFFYNPSPIAYTPPPVAVFAGMDASVHFP
jgi:hypothetical protein